MTVDDVFNLLAHARDARGISHWERLGERTGGLQSFGIGLTRLRKFAKQIGRDRELAKALWRTELYDAKVIALLIDDPKQITREEAEQQVGELHGGMLAHVFASCDATLAKTPFVIELAEKWVYSEDAIRRDCGYGLMYEVSKFTGKKAPSEAFFIKHIEHISATIDGELENVRLAMAFPLMGIGKRNAALNKAALRVARAVGPIEFFSASGNCEPFDVVKHLTAKRLQAKLNASSGKA